MSDGSNIRRFAAPDPAPALADLHRRLDAARWPEPETVVDRGQGVPIAELRDLISYWRHEHDWRACAHWLETAGQFATEIDGTDIHFLHLRSPHDDALPLLMTHGWPGAMLEFRRVAPRLLDPTAHGGRAEDAFHLILPSLPGFGFSGKPATTGWGVRRIARAWAVLMERLGYTRYVAQGGDWGAAVTTELGVLQPAGLQAIHLNMPLVLPADLGGPHSAAEAAMLADLAAYQAQEGGYAAQQATRPQTIGYALADSPIGQAAWIYEKFGAWIDPAGNPCDVLPLDEMLDIITLYWLTNSAASSARLYWESFYADGFGARDLRLPVGCSIFPRELYRAPRSWAERCMSDIIYWGEPARGGHFAAFEQPAIFADELRACFRPLR